MFKDRVQQLIKNMEKTNSNLQEGNYMEKNKKENTNNLISRIKARANADRNTEEKKSPDSLILRIKRRANADKNKERER